MLVEMRDARNVGGRKPGGHGMAGMLGTLSEVFARRDDENDDMRSG